MLLDVLTVSFALLLGADFAQASPSLRRSPTSQGRGLHVPLLRRAAAQRNETELGIWAKQQKQLLESKYGQPSTTSVKRSSGYNLCASGRGGFANLGTKNQPRVWTKNYSRGKFFK
jgi:hypothetical protein